MIHEKSSDKIAVDEIIKSIIVCAITNRPTTCCLCVEQSTKVKTNEIENFLSMKFTQLSFLPFRFVDFRSLHSCYVFLLQIKHLI